jgi:hypothetical protein
MRTNFNVPAMEAEVLDTDMPPSDVQVIGLESISMEEAELLIHEATTNSNDAESQLSEVERILEVSDALEDLAVIAGSIEKATPAEAALIENTGNMAVAGSDVDPEKVIPAMESFIGGRIAIEDIRTTARTIWENIQKFLKQVWDAIESFFTNILSTIPRMRKALDELEKRVTAVSGVKPLTDKIKLTSSLTNLHVGGKPLKNEHDMLQAYAALRIAVKWVYGQYVETVTKRGRIIATAIGSIDPAETSLAVSKLRTELLATKPAPVPGGSGVDNKRFPGFATTFGSDLPGNVSIACKYYNDNKDNVTSLAALDRYRNSRCELAAVADSVEKTATEIELTPFSTAAMGTLINDMRELLDTLSSYKFGAKSKEVASVRKLINEASDKAQRVVGSLANGDEGHQSSVINYRALMNFNASYARWAQTPSMPMMSHSLNVTKTLMVVIQKSLHAYSAT